MVIRDIDILRQFEAIRVNMSIPTDSEEVRQAFEPKAPPLERRWQAAAQCKAAGIPVGVCVTPMLPLENPEAFVQKLVDFKPDVLVVQDFHDSGGGFGADTGQRARDLLANSYSTDQQYRHVTDQLRRRCLVFEGEEGFFPPASPLGDGSITE
jgi:DNA repair photolyase